MNKKTLRLLAIFAVLLIAVAAVYFLTRKPTTQGNKTITVTVVFEDGSEKVHTVKTDGEYLIDAIKDFVTGEDSSYGFFITGVDGVEADSTAEQWWCLNDGNGEMLMTGASETPIQDGESYQLVFTTGYDF